MNTTVEAEAVDADRLCSEGGGFRNTARVELATPTGAAADPEAEACADPASPTVSKRVVSVVAGATAGQWTVTYMVTTANGSLTQLTYSLDDDLGFPTGVTITSTSVSRVHSALDGSGATAPETIPTGTASSMTLASNRALPAQSKDTYTVIVGATVPSSLPADVLACSTAGAGHGWFNSATVGSGSDHFTADACDPIMPTAAKPPAVVTPPVPPAPVPTTPRPVAPSPTIPPPVGVGANSMILRAH